MKHSDIVKAVLGKQANGGTFAKRIDLGRVESVRSPSGPGRNDPCPCGSGKKFKRCHGAKSSPVP